MLVLMIIPLHFCCWLFDCSLFNLKRFKILLGSKSTVLQSGRAYCKKWLVWAQMGVFRAPSHFSFRQPSRRFRKRAALFSLLPTRHLPFDGLLSVCSQMNKPVGGHHSVFNEDCANYCQYFSGGNQSFWCVFFARRFQLKGEGCFISRWWGPPSRRRCFRPCGVSFPPVVSGGSLSGAGASVRWSLSRTQPAARSTQQEPFDPQNKPPVSAQQAAQRSGGVWPQNGIHNKTKKGTTKIHKSTCIRKDAANHTLIQSYKGK